MPIKVVGLLHTGIRIPTGDDDLAAAHAVYCDLLGLEVDDKRGHIQGVPGFWSNIRSGDRGQQIHIMGSDGASPAARSEKQDPTRPHVAFAVEDIDGAKAELTRLGIEFWVYESLVGKKSVQVFFEDGCSNMIELQQVAG